MLARFHRCSLRTGRGRDWANWEQQDWQSQLERRKCRTLAEWGEGRRGEGSVLTNADDGAGAVASEVAHDHQRRRSGRDDQLKRLQDNLLGYWIIVDRILNCTPPHPTRAMVSLALMSGVRAVEGVQLTSEVVEPDALVVEKVEAGDQGHQL